MIRMIWWVTLVLVACGKTEDRGSGSASGAPSGSAAAVDEHSREGAIRAAVAAMAAGDLEKLVALVDPIGTCALDCTKAKPLTNPHEGRFRDPKQKLSSTHKDFARALGARKGTKIEVATIAQAKDDNVVPMETGSSVSGCVVKAPYRVVLVNVDLKVGPDAWTESTSIALTETGGRFYPVGPPVISTKRMLLTLAEMSRDEICECHDKACVDSLARRQTAVQLLALSHEPATDDDKRKATAVDEASERCKKQATGSMTWEESFAKEAEYIDRICACKDRKCVDGVTAELTKWSAETSSKLDTSKPPDPALAKRGEELTKRMEDCTKKRR